QLAGELMPHAARRKAGGRIRVGRFALYHQYPAIEGRLGGQKIGDGTADDAATDNNDVPGLCSHRRFTRMRISTRYNDNNLTLVGEVAFRPRVATGTTFGAC